MGFMDFAKKAGRMMVMGEVDLITGIRSQKKLAAEGTPTTAVCRSFEIQWDRAEGDARWLALEGKQLPVRVDPSDPQKVAVDWDAILAE